MSGAVRHLLWSPRWELERTPKIVVRELEG
jgi:hypothetical protein